MNGSEFRRVTAEIATVSRARAEAIKELSGAVSASVGLFTRKDKLAGRLMKLGIALLLCPDPFSDVPAYFLIAAALIESRLRRKGLRVKEVPLAFMDTYRELLRLRSEFLRQ